MQRKTDYDVIVLLGGIINNEIFFTTQLPTSFEYEKLRKVNVHSFRHLNASLLISNGVDVKTVQAYLGHAQASTTMNIYAHSFMETQTKASEAVANSFAFTKAKEQSENQA